MAAVFNHCESHVLLGLGEFFRRTKKDVVL